MSCSIKQLDGAILYGPLHLYLTIIPPTVAGYEMVYSTPLVAYNHVISNKRE